VCSRDRHVGTLCLSPSPQGEVARRRFEFLDYCGLYRRFREVLGLLVRVSQAAKVILPKAQELLALSWNPVKLFPIL
ncbi:hypothetical protein WG66_003150, partial [Moniliophthora roreri]